jgi:hypothetical protein
MGRHRKAGVAVVAAVVVGVGAVPVASAAPAADRGLAAIQAAAAAATTRREGSLQAALSQVTAGHCLSAAHRAKVQGILDADLGAMRGLSAKIAGDTDRATAHADFRSIFDGYRIYAVALPQAFLASAADCLTVDTLPHLSAAHAALAAALGGPLAAKDTPALDSELADMATRISAADAALTGAADGSLGVTPAAYDANHGALTSYGATIALGDSDAKYAAADAETIVAALK